MKARESQLWSYLKRVVQGKYGIIMHRMEFTDAGKPDVYYEISGLPLSHVRTREHTCMHSIRGDCAKHVEISEESGLCSLEQRDVYQESAGWIELKLVKLEDCSYTGVYSFGLRSEQALFLNTLWRNGGNTWVMLGITEAGEWQKFMLVSGKYAYRILRKISLIELESIAHVFVKTVDPLQFKQCLQSQAE